MTISVGDRIPSINLTRMTDDGPQAVSTDDLFAGRKVVLFAVPGAYTPTCSAQHLPGFTANADALRAKGVDAVALPRDERRVRHGRVGQGPGHCGQGRDARGRERRVHQGDGPRVRPLGAWPRRALAALRARGGRRGW